MGHPRFEPIWIAERWRRRKPIDRWCHTRRSGLVVLREDILTVPDKRIERMQVFVTGVGGKTVFERQ
jgi:hypothetical protein